MLSLNSLEGEQGEPGYCPVELVSKQPFYSTSYPEYLLIYPGYGVAFVGVFSRHFLPMRKLKPGSYIL